ncbi:MAG: glycosyltransferase family 4 protein [Candidatus Azobacteroides sp.]|nr:glycosyltransferase family 4 protein [Candidatus Azobacteroides sp.]
MRIAFYLRNANISTIDCRNILDGNPGIGGSEYAIISVATLLSQRNKGFDIVLYAQDKGLLPDNLHIELADNIDLSVQKAIEQVMTLMIVDCKDMDNATVIKYSKTMNFVIWGHNFLPYRTLNFYARQQNILRIVNVGREQWDLWRDHPIFCKSDYIYNGIFLPSISKHDITPYHKRSKNVIYIGSLMHIKGFHVLAKAWKIVLKSVPEANLYVVGSGKLYNKNSELGKWGIADNEYENTFMPDLLDEAGNLLPSVHFMGIMGKEKNDLLLKCKVGVPNPSGNTETFGFTAIEMQAMGCLVTTKRCPGYLDTVAPNGILYESESQLAGNIVRLLQRTNNDYLSMYNFIKNRFDYDLIISEWEKLLYNCETRNKKHIHSISPLSNPMYHCKKLKEFMRKLKELMPFTKHIPPIELIIKLCLKISKYCCCVIF